MNFFLFDLSLMGENFLFNILFMFNFDQLGLENVLDKFLLIDGFVWLFLFFNDFIVYFCDNVFILFIGQFGLDSFGLFG